MSNYIKTLFSLLVLSVAFMGCGAEQENLAPPITIEGCEKPLPLGEMVTLKATTPEKNVKNLSDVHYDWKVFDAAHHEKTNIFISPDSSTIYFTSGVQPGKYLVTVEAVYTYAPSVTSKYFRTSGILHKEVTVGDGASPTPSPTPVPQPPAPPPIPDGLYGLTKLTYDTVLTSVKSPKKKEAAHALADNYLGLASQAAAGVIPTIEDLQKKLKEGNQEAFAKVGEIKENWSDWDGVIRKRVYSLHVDGKVTDGKTYGEVLRAIGDGLSLVK